jgi:hypothetical protein
MSTHIRKNKNLNLLMYLKLLEKQEQANAKSSRWIEITKFSAEINEMHIKKMIQ